MDGKKKAAGWLVLTMIVVVAAVALAVTNIATEGPISQRNLGEAQVALEGMFPDATDFEEMAVEESGGLGFAYRVLKSGQPVGYAGKTTVQGYAGAIEIIYGVDTQGKLKGINVGGSDFKETEGLGAKAKDPAFTDLFKDKTPPLTLGQEVDGISGATITSRAVVDGVNAGVSKLQAVAGITQTAGEDGNGRMANASVIGYGGPVLVSLSLSKTGEIAALEVGKTRFAETEGVGSKVREDSFVKQFIGKKPPINDVDVIAGATISSQAVVEAVNEAAAFLNP
ncbi:MAG: FMN-binding protein [Eubacteriales bacterium]|nr:FMN-binding protein [Eubacteriales bacterium]